MAGEEALLMSSLVLILAIFLRKKKEQEFRSEDAINVSADTEDAKNVVIPAIQRQNNILRRTRKTMCTWKRDLNIQRVRRNCKTAKELGSVLQFVSHVYKLRRFCFERTTDEARVWKIMLPDCLAGICHYTRCDWPQIV